MIRLGSEVVRSVVFGALDGILTSFGIIASILGSNMAARVVMLIGFANVIADGITMGVGEALSIHTKRSGAKNVKRRQQWLYDHKRMDIIASTMQQYVNRGVNPEDATRILLVLTKPRYRDFFINHSMSLQTGQESPEANALESSHVSLLRTGFAMLASFLVFGSLPLLPYLVFDLVGYQNKHGQFGVSCGATTVALILLGTMQV